MLLLAGLSLGGCKSTEKAVFRTIRANNSVALGTLPKLEAVVDAGPLTTNSEDGYPEDPGKVFRQELSYHLAESAATGLDVGLDSVQYGYAKLQITQAQQQRTGRVLQAFQLLTLMTPSLLGIPLEWYRTDLQAEVQIIDARGEVIGTYTGRGRSKVRVAMYHGYGQGHGHAARLADVQSLRLALDQIRPQLEEAADTLRQQLLSTGPVQEVIGVSSVE
ncbi:hypothetical protein [Hymenobacter actinosclerus]|uniref:Uncharacterized protein n=1 Tax=Hymenobacter actinosclerus TaxID=82805 RepID=A0A1I0B8X7_9BACT|nr:hypothetical protein [Hymenobacter actinosclerus]SET03241.1 hypothetical protein SAMN04487998_0979 [Hymenobacter actinosclerus]